MSDLLLCLDSNIFIKALVPEEPEEQGIEAERLLRLSEAGALLVAPSWSWAEVGSVLRKKVRQLALSSEEADAAWARYCALPISYVDFPALRARSWELAVRYGLPAIYDATFLACAELAPALDPVEREFWTADRALVRALGADRPVYVRQLSE